MHLYLTLSTRDSSKLSFQNVWFALISLLLDHPSEAQEDEFLFEISMMKVLGAHQNIVSLVGCCTLQDHKFLVIEYVPFGDLLHWLRRKRRSVGSYFLLLLSRMPFILFDVTLPCEDGDATYSSINCRRCFTVPLSDRL